MSQIVCIIKNTFLFKKRPGKILRKIQYFLFFAHSLSLEALQYTVKKKKKSRHCIKVSFISISVNVIEEEM